MTQCEFCGKTMADDARFCPRCGKERTDGQRDGEDITASPVDKTQPIAIEESAADVADDGWRPFRYERPARRTSRAESRSQQPARRALRLLAGWLAALIVMAGGLFWYIWSEDEAPAQPQPAALTAAVQTNG